MFRRRLLGLALAVLAAFPSVSAAATKASLALSAKALAPVSLKLAPALLGANLSQPILASGALRPLAAVLPVQPVAALPAPMEPGRGAFGHLTELAQGAEDAGRGELEERQAQVFDHAGKTPVEVYAREPRLPVGAISVSVNEVRTDEDIERLIPPGTNSNGLIAGLKSLVEKMVPYNIYVYKDSGEDVFTAIDLSLKPELVEFIPELDDHERQLIQRIQKFDRDLQVIVREPGKTPDTIVGGTITELKSLIGSQVDVTFLLNKANTQVYEHAQRHGLGHGAVAMDLTRVASRVPMEEVLADINGWASLPQNAEVPLHANQGGGVRSPKSPVFLDKISVYAGEDRKVFLRQLDGSYRLEE